MGKRKGRRFREGENSFGCSKYTETFPFKSLPPSVLSLPSFVAFVSLSILLFLCFLLTFTLKKSVVCVCVDDGMRMRIFFTMDKKFKRSLPFSSLSLFTSSLTPESYFILSQVILFRFMIVIVGLSFPLPV